MDEKRIFFAFRQRWEKRKEKNRKFKLGKGKKKFKRQSCITAKEIDKNFLS